MVSIKKQQVIQAGADAINMFGFGGMKAIINMPASIISKSQKQNEEIINSYIVLDAAPNRQIPIVFKEISLEADAASQTYPVTFIFNEPKDLVLLPGMNAVVWLQDPRVSASDVHNVSIPLTAIATDGEQKYVWVVDASTMTVSKRNVSIKLAVGTYVEILSGLTSGETIVSAGISFLSEGMKVSAWSK